MRARFRVNGASVCLQPLRGGLVTVWGRWAGRDGGERTQQETLAERAGASWRGRSVVRALGQLQSGRQAGSGIARSRAKALLNWVSQGPAPWQMQGQSACRAGESSGQGEDPSSERLGGHDLLTQADAGCPAGQVVRHHLYRQPGAVGGEAARGEMVEPDAVLEVAYRILDLGVAAMVSLQFEHLPVPVGDEAVIAVGGE